MASTAVKEIFSKTVNHSRVEELKFVKENDLLPYFRELESDTQPEVLMEGKTRLMLGSNNYLGLTGDLSVKAAAHKAIDVFGTGLTGSRLLNGTSLIHSKLEEEIAEWQGTEGALVFSTGYQANLGAISSIAGEGDTVICDRFDHASIYDACTLSGANVKRFNHGDYHDLERLLKQGQDGGETMLVVVDSVYSMEGDICRLDLVADLCEQYDAGLMVDEAHGVGVFGKEGRGLIDLFGVSDRVDLRMGTFSKSLASCGGYVAAPSYVIDYMQIFSRPMLFTAAAVPAAVAAAAAALNVCRSTEGDILREQVVENARYLNRSLTALGIEVVSPTEVPEHNEITTPVVPVVVGDDIMAIAFWKNLYDEGLYTNVAVYPAVPRDGALIRTSVMASHTKEQLDQAVAIFEKVLERFPDIPRR